MLYELIKEVLTAKTPQKKERAYRKLQKLGIDRLTANVLAAEMRKGVR